MMSAEEEEHKEREHEHEEAGDEEGAGGRGWVMCGCEGRRVQLRWQAAM